MGEPKKVTMDHYLAERAIRRKVEVSAEVEGARGELGVSGRLSFEELRSGGFIKQRQADLFTVRCRCPGGRVPVAGLRAVADAAERLGQGYVHLSCRQSLEIPYVDYRSFGDLQATLERAEMRVASCGPRVRVPTACSGCEYNPNGLTDTQGMAALIDREFFGVELYHKFKISLSGCPIDCMRSNEMDLGFQGAVFPKWSSEKCTGCGVCAIACKEGAITTDVKTGFPQFDPPKCLYCADCIRACPSESWTEGLVGWVVRVGGHHGRRPLNGALLARFVPDALIPEVIKSVAGWYREAGRGGARKRVGEFLRQPGAMASLAETIPASLQPYLCADLAGPQPIFIHRYPNGGKEILP